MLTMKDWPKLEKAYKNTVDEILATLKERAEEKKEAAEETKLRSIPVERGGRYLIIVEPRKLLSMAECGRVETIMNRLNTWLTDENTPFKTVILFDTDVRFERVKAATDEAQHQGD